MTCESCKGTRQITLAYSVVECLDCPPGWLNAKGTPVSELTIPHKAQLPAAPMVKVRELLDSGRLLIRDHEFRVGDRLRHIEAGMVTVEATVEAIESPTGKPGWYWVRCDRNGTSALAHGKNMKREETI